MSWVVCPKINWHKLSLFFTLSCSLKTSFVISYLLPRPNTGSSISSPSSAPTSFKRLMRKIRSGSGLVIRPWGGGRTNGNRLLCEGVNTTFEYRIYFRVNIARGHSRSHGQGRRLVFPAWMADKRGNGGRRWSKCFEQTRSMRKVDDMVC